jgi:hypothetical protein
MSLIRLLFTSIMIVSLMCIQTAYSQESQSDLSFTETEPGIFAFDTGVVRGRLQADGRHQGIVSLVDIETGTELVHGAGAMSLYRVFSGSTRFCDAARNWPVASSVLYDGSVDLRFPTSETHPMTIVARFVWSASDALDLELSVVSEQAVPDFELFLSSYFSNDMKGAVYVQPNYFASGEPEMLPTDVNPMVDGAYLAFPRDDEAVRKIFDGRWDQPPHPVQWAITRRYAGAMAIRRSEASGVTVAMAAPVEDCFAVLLPYDKTPPDGPSSHASLYLSLFGGDLEPGETSTARSRLYIGRNMTDEEVIERYQTYISD